MDLKNSTDRLRRRIAKVGDLNAVVKFDFGADGVVVIDGRSNPPTVSNRNRNDVDCVVTLSLESLNGVVDGKVNPAVAFIMGKIKVRGDRSHLLKLQKLL